MSKNIESSMRNKKAFENKIYNIDSDLRKEIDKEKRFSGGSEEYYQSEVKVQDLHQLHNTVTGKLTR